MNFLVFLGGVLSGILGVFPFVHTNAILQIASSYGITAVEFAVALSFSHAIFEILPSVFFGIPSAAHSVSVLPAHSLAMEGKGMSAVKIMLYSFMISIVFSVFLLPPLFFSIPIWYSFLKPFLLPIFVTLIFLFFISDLPRNAALGLLIFLVSGLLGVLTLLLPITKNPLFPLLTGLFGLPSLLLSIKGGAIPSLSHETPVKIDLKFVAAGSVVGALSGFMPALSPAFLSSIAFLFFESTPLSFIMLSSAIVASKMFYDFVFAVTIHKARSAAATFLLSSSPNILIIAVIALFSSLFAFWAVYLFKEKIAKIFRKNFILFNVLLYSLVILAIFVICGLPALLVLACATAIGLLPPLFKVRRAYCLGSLIMPSLLHSLFLTSLFLSLF